MNEMGDEERTFEEFLRVGFFPELQLGMERGTVLTILGEPEDYATAMKGVEEMCYSNYAFTVSLWQNVVSKIAIYFRYSNGKEVELPSGLKCHVPLCRRDSIEAVREYLDGRRIPYSIDGSLSGIQPAHFNIASSKDPKVVVGVYFDETGLDSIHSKEGAL